MVSNSAVYCHGHCPAPVFFKTCLGKGQQLNVAMASNSHIENKTPDQSKLMLSHDVANACNAVID